MEIPSFEQFKKIRENWKEDEDLGLIDKGSLVLNPLIKKHQYEICGYRCKTLEEVEKVARNQGIPLKELDYRPMIIPQSGHKCDVLVRFLPREEIQRRANW